MGSAESMHNTDAVDNTIEPSIDNAGAYPRYSKEPKTARFTDEPRPSRIY
jgi:hypothetical protein